MVVQKRLRNALHVIGLYAVAGICVSYFLYHAQHGARGLVSRQSIDAEISGQRRQLAELRSERKAWDDRVDLLRRDATDRDILEERVRDVLGRVHRNDVVIIDQ